MRLWKIGLQSLAALVMALVGGTAHAQSSCLPRLAMGPQMPFPTIANRGTDDVVLSSTTWDPDGAGYQRERLVIGGVLVFGSAYLAGRYGGLTGPLPAAAAPSIVPQSGSWAMRWLRAFARLRRLSGRCGLARRGCLAC